jgi:hypothetical protein
MKFPGYLSGSTHNRAHQLTLDALCGWGFRAPPDTQQCTDDYQYNIYGSTVDGAVTVLFRTRAIPLTGFLQKPAGRQPPLPFLSGGLHWRMNSGGDKREHATNAHEHQDNRIIILKMMNGLPQQGSCHIPERTFTITHPHHISFFHFPGIKAQ